jgi:carboxylesterase type B
VQNVHIKNRAGLFVVYESNLAGFLNPNPGPLTRGSVANYGLVDQMAALQWVTENILEFGGDPGTETE